jgi:tetratricopeptide (TPR) repeat protein
VVTYRDDEVGPAHPLGTVIGDLATARWVRRIELPALSRDAVATLARPEGIDPDRLHPATGGNPFFVTEVLGAPGREVPPTVRDAVLARAARLSPTARGALDAAAVVPDRVELTLLEAVAAADAAAIDECLRAGMLRDEGRAVRFRHELARLAVERAVPAARRVELHRRILAHLAAVAADEPARLAHHAEEAGLPAAVLEHATAAAQRAAALGAHREAVDHYARALRFADGLPPRRLAELLERYAVECSRTDRMAAALGAADRALACWRREGDRDREGALLARRSQYLWGTGQSAEALEAAAAAAAMLEAGPPRPALATAYSWLALNRMLARDVGGAIEVGERATELSERFGERELLSRALNAVGSSQWFSDPDWRRSPSSGASPSPGTPATTRRRPAPWSTSARAPARSAATRSPTTGCARPSPGAPSATSTAAAATRSPGWRAATSSRDAGRRRARRPPRSPVTARRGRRAGASRSRCSAGCGSGAATPTPSAPSTRHGTWPSTPATCSGSGRWRPRARSAPG